MSKQILKTPNSTKYFIREISGTPSILRLIYRDVYETIGRHYMNQLGTGTVYKYRFTMEKFEPYLHLNIYLNKKRVVKGVKCKMTEPRIVEFLCSAINEQLNNS